MLRMLAATLAVAAASLPAQDPNEVVARYRLGDKPAVVTRTDLAVEMAFHLRRADEGKQACAMLVDSHLTQRAAEREKCLPSEKEVRAFWETLQAQLRAAGRKPEEFAAVRNSTPAEWLRDLSVQIAQERLVRKVLGLGNSDAVSGDMLQLWLADERKRATIVDDPAQLPAGVAVRVDGKDLPMVELGLLLLRTSEDAEREKFLQQVVFLNCLEARALARGIEATPERIDAAIAERRAMAAKDPSLGSASYEQLLAARGLTIASLQQSRVFRANILIEQLALADWPDAVLRDEIAKDRDAALRRAGPRRHLAIILRRALDEPNALVPDDFAAATAKLEALKVRLAKEAFADIARMESDDAQTRMTGGDAGWFARGAAQLPEPLLAAVFAAAIGDVVGPVRGRNGCYLAKVLEAEPELPEAEVLRRLRELHQNELTQQILTDAHIEPVGAAAGEEHK